MNINPLDLPEEWRKTARRCLGEKRLRSMNNTLRFCARQLAFALKHQERTCIHCGCSDSRACKGGCSWIIKHKFTPTGVCSSCKEAEGFVEGQD